MNRDKMSETGRALDRISGFRFTSKKPEVTRKIFVKEKTRLPLIFISASVATSILALAVYFFEKARLAEEERKWAITNRETQKRFVAVLEQGKPAAPKPLPSPAKAASYTVIPSTPLATPRPSPYRTIPKVRANVAEVDGQPVR